MPVFSEKISLTIDGVEKKQRSDGTVEYMVPQGSPFVLDVSVSANKELQSNKIDVAGLDKFSVMGQGSSQQFSTINGVMSFQKTIHVTIASSQEGVYTVGPAHITIDGNHVESNTIFVNVSKDVKSNGSQGSGSGQVGGQSGDVKVFCKLSTDKKQAVRFEPIVVRLKIYTNTALHSLELVKIPTFNDFLSKEIKKIENKRETIDGQQFDVTEKTFVIFPLKEGVKKITPATIVAGIPEARTKKKRRGFMDEDFFFDFFGPRFSNRQIDSNALEITVNPVPEHSGILGGVGIFTTWHAQLEKDMISVNEPVVFTVTLEGRGNLENVAVPKLNLPASVKYYESKTTIDEDVSVAYVGGKKTFEFILQASQPGQLEIPEQVFTFFDTQSKTFKTLKTEPFTLKVTGVAVPAPTVQSTPQSPTPEQQEQEAPVPQEKKDDIHFIMEECDHKEAPAPLPLWLFVMLLFAPLVFWGNILRSLVSIARGNFYKKNSMGAYTKELSVIIKTQSVQELYQFFIAVLAAKYHVSVHEVTQDWIEQVLEKDQWAGSKIDEFSSYLSLCAQVNFSFNKEQKKHSDEMLKKAEYWFLNITK
jgi:hypothetical protein